MRRFKVKTIEFVEKELEKGEHAEIEWGKRTKHVVKGFVRRREFSQLIGKHNAYEINLGNGEKIYVKMQVLGEIPATQKNDTVALAAMSSVEIYGYNDTLRSESGPVLVRVSVQRHTPDAADPKQYLRAAAIARNIPTVLKTGHIVSDLGPENVGQHVYDIYITPGTSHDIDHQIIRMKSIQQYIERYGAEGLRVLADIHEMLGNKKYAGSLRHIANRYERERYLDFGDYKIVTNAYISALRDYPKTDKFWEGAHRDILAELEELQAKGVRGKSVENVRIYANRVLMRKGLDWRERLWHTTVVKKNLTKLWLYALKRKGIIKSLTEEPPRQPAGPSRRP